MIRIREASKLKINLIAFVVLSALLVYGMAGRVLRIFDDRYSVNAIFADAGGVFTNQEVTYRGLNVGQVGRMEVVEDGVRIELLIDGRYEIPREDTQARVMFKSAVGEQFVDILPQREGPPFLEHGDEIPMENTSIPVSTQELLTTLQNVLRGVPPEALEGAVDAMGVGLTGRGPDLAMIIESMADLAEMFAERAPEVEGILTKGTEVGDAFLGSKEDFARAVAHLVTVSDTLATSTSDLRRLMQGGNLTSDEVVALLRDNRPGIHRFLRRFAKLNEIQAQKAGSLNDLLRFLPSGLDRVTRTFEPSTGLVRFGLVDDFDNPGCSYGTPRRSPEQRGNRRVPRSADCGPRRGGQNSSHQQSQQTMSIPEEESTAEAALPGAELDDTGQISLPPRMKSWSWSLVYLYGL
jgi:phospholipid/cholesterol/gamma-HCH transport system substrate-binding protein